VSWIPVVSPTAMVVLAGGGLRAIEMVAGVAGGVELLLLQAARREIAASKMNV
jgi:hypothetical protein